MSRELEGLLKARKYPVQVLYDPAVSTPETYPYTVTIERDGEGSDTFKLGAMGAQANPRKWGSRYLAVKATLRARSNAPHSHVGHHQFECERLLDAVLTALASWAEQSKKPVEISAGRYVKPVALDGVKVLPGVVYELKFMVGRGLFEVTYSGEARPEGSFESVAGQTQAAGYSGDPGTGCGA